MTDVQILSTNSVAAFKESLRQDIENLRLSLDELKRTDQEPALVQEIETAVSQSSTLLEEFEDASQRCLKALLQGRRPDMGDESLMKQLGFVLPAPSRPAGASSPSPSLLPKPSFSDTSSGSRPPPHASMFPDSVSEPPPRPRTSPFSFLDQPAGSRDSQPPPPSSLRSAPPPPPPNVSSTSTISDTVTKKSFEFNKSEEFFLRAPSSGFPNSENSTTTPRQPLATSQPSVAQPPLSTMDLSRPLRPDNGDVISVAPSAPAELGAAELKLEIARLTSENEKLKKESSEISDECAKRRREADDLRRLLDSETSERKRVSSDFALLKERSTLELDSWRSENAALAAECRKLRDECEASRALARQRDDLLAQLDTLKAERGRGEADAWRVERQQLIEALSKKEDEANQFRIAVQELRSEAQALQQQLNDAHEEELKYAQSKLSQTQDELARTKDRESALRAEISRLEQQDCRPSSELHHPDGTSSHSSREQEYIGQLQDTIESLRRERDGLKEVVREQHRAFYDSVESLVKNENSSLRMAMEQLQREVQNKEQAVATEFSELKQRLDMFRPAAPSSGSAASSRSPQRDTHLETTAIQAIQAAEATLNREPGSSSFSEDARTRKQMEIWYQPTDPFDPLDVAVQEVLKSLRCPVKIELHRLGRGEYMADKRLKLRLVGDEVLVQKGMSFTPLSGYLQAVYAHHLRKPNNGHSGHLSVEPDTTPRQPNTARSTTTPSRSVTPGRAQQPQLQQQQQQRSAPRSTSAPRGSVARDNLATARTLLSAKRPSAIATRRDSSDSLMASANHATLLQQATRTPTRSASPAKKPPVVQGLGEAYEDAIRQADAMRETMQATGGDGTNGSGEDEDEKIKLLKKLALRQQIASMKKAATARAALGGANGVPRR